MATFYKGRVHAERWSRKMLRRIRRAKRQEIYVQHKNVMATWGDMLLLGGPFVHSMGLHKPLRKESVRQVDLFVAVIGCL